MRIKKSFIIICIVTILLVLHSLSVPADAATADQGGSFGDLEWFYSEGVLTISGEGEMDDDYFYDYDWPWAHLEQDVHTVCIDEGVTNVGIHAFEHFKAICTVTLPSSLTEIGRYAFFRCDNLEAIYWNGMTNTLPDNLESIDICAFCGCIALEDITMGPNLSYVADGAFSQCDGLKRVTLSPVLTEINDISFYGCTGLQTVTFPASVTTIGEEAFAYCYDLKYIQFTGDAPQIHETAFTPGASDMSIIAYYPANNLTWTADKMSDYGAVCQWKPMDEPSLPDDSCGENLDWFIDEGTLVIYGSGPMANFIFNTAPWDEFSEEIYTIYIDDGVTTIGDLAFAGFQDLSTVRLPDTLTQIGDYAFTDCVNLAWILDSNLEQRIPDGVVSIGKGAFDSCEMLSELTLGKNVAYLGDYAFQYCFELKQILLSPALSYIGDEAFSVCYNLRSVYFPASVSYVGNNAFSYCDSLKEIIFAGNAPVIADSAFVSSEEEPLQITAYYPTDDATWTAEKRSNYGAEITWKTKPADCVSIGSCGDNLTWELKQDGTLYISGTGEMYNYDTIDYPPWYILKDQITSLIIEDGATTIGETAFYKCFQIKTVTIPNSVTKICDYAFFDCKGLTYVYISAYVTEIGEDAFTACEALEEIIVSKDNPNYTSDSYGVLFDKDMKTLIVAPGTIAGHYTIPYGVTEIGESSFYACLNLTGVTIPSTVTTIGNGAFSCCFGLTSVIIPSSVTLIDHGAFWYCHRLEEIIFCGDAPTFVGEKIFVNVNAIAYYPANNPTWTQDKFVHGNSNITWTATDNCQIIGHQAYTYRYTSGVHSFTCTKCGKTVTKAAADGKKFAINSAALVLSDDIIMKYSTTIPAGFENPYVVFDFNGESTVVNEYAVNASNGRYEFSFPGLNPQKMGDNICATLYATVDGVPVSVQIASYSIVKYCDNQLKKTTISAELRTALSDLLIYGECNQIYENYKTDTLITSLLSANSTLTPSTFPEGGLDASFNKQKLSGTSLADCTFSGVTMSLGAKVVVRLIITCNDISKYTFKATLNGVDFVFTGEDLVPVEGSTNKYYLNFDQIKATLLGDVITFTIWDGDTQVSRTVEYTAYTYVQKNQGTTNETLANLLKALYNYGESVKKV